MIECARPLGASTEVSVRAVIFEEFGGPLRVAEVPDPTPRPDGVVLAVRSTGICRSDWHGWQGHDPDVRLPHVPGHELAGEVVAVGASVRGLSIGDRVTVPFVSGCGECAPYFRHRRRDGDDDDRREHVHHLLRHERVYGEPTL